MIYDSPGRYAKHLASYIASPTKIESLTRIEFDTAPPLHEIAEMRFAVERARREFARPIWVKDSEERDGEDYALPSLLRRPLRRRIVPAQIAFRPPVPSTNPFLQPWCLTQAVVASVAADFGLCAADVMSVSRRRENVWARAVAIKLLSERGLSASGIGRKLGRDHSTVLWALDRFDVYERQCETVGASYRRHIALLEEAGREVAV